MVLRRRGGPPGSARTAPDRPSSRIRVAAVEQPPSRERHAVRAAQVPLSGVGLGYMLQGGGGLDERGVQGLGSHTMMVSTRGGPLTENLESNPPEGTLAFSLVPGTLVVVMPVAPGGTTIRWKFPDESPGFLRVF